MKIAILGNMNNNGFSIMRYFHDLGVDAHLLLYANDGSGSLRHFCPENDTWYMDKWAKYIHQTTIPNSPYTDLSGIVAYLLCKVQFVVWRLQGKTELHNPWISIKRILNDLSGYDKYIGSGIAPGLFKRIGKRLDIFFPYTTGIEHLGSMELTSSLPYMNLVKRWVTMKAIAKQKEGILDARFVINPELSLTRDVLNSLNVSFVPLFIPMVYLEDPGDEAQFSPGLQNTLKRIDKKKYFFSSARQLWVRSPQMTTEKWKSETKNSDWLIRAFAQFIRARSNHDFLLVLMEYGPDVNASRRLCKELGVDERVIWVPKMARKEVMVLAQGAYAIAGEFRELGEMIWGGTGLEALAAGKPLMHSFRFGEGRFEDLYGMPRPPIMPVAREQDIFHHMIALADDPGLTTKIGIASSKWFSDYFGINLAKKWLELLLSGDFNFCKNV